MKVAAIVSFPVHVELELPDGIPQKNRDDALIKEAVYWLEFAAPWKNYVHKMIHPVISIEREEPGFAPAYRGKRTPKVGDIIYVPTQMYIDRGEDDVQGGRARVTKVKGTFVTTREHPGNSYNWECLVHEQEKLEKEYGMMWAHPDPDV